MKLISDRGEIEAVGYTQHHLCRQPHAKMAIPGGFSLLCWVDTINIKTNPNDIVLLAGVLSCQTPTSGGIGGLRTATNPQGCALVGK